MFDDGSIVGFVVSCTVTLNFFVVVLPAWSDTEHVTSVVAIAIVDPDAGEQLMASLAPSTMSLTDTL